MSPTPQSPSIKSQDSPSFPYPTPPASLESHPALQSPLFSFGGSSSIGTTTFYGFEHMTCDPVTINMMEMSGGGPGSDGDSKLFSSDSPSVDEIVLRLGKAIKQEVGTLISMTPESEPIQEDVKIKIEPVDASGVVSFGSSEVTKFLTPSSSPKRFAGPESPQSVPSGSVLNESKVNEALQPLGSFGSSLDSRLDGFLNPNRVATNTHSYVKSGKRKQVRNTFASNLRQNPSSQSQLPHFTPYPILSPVRSAPGLYWTFSQKLSHVEDSVRECPRINVGPTFQATNLPEPFSRSRKRKASSAPEPQSDPEVEILEVIESNDGNAPLWDPNAMQHCSTDEVEKYLEFACCSAVPGGGRNKEYALHLLNHFKGDINAAILLLMNPQPQVPTALRTYGYSDNAKWTPSELIVFQESLLKYGKNFGTLAAQIPTKSRADCISFYHLWKKICPNEYERIRTTWKKREAAFTLDLLKSVPPTTPGALAALAHAQHDQPLEPIVIDSPENPHQQKKLGVPEIRTVNNGQIDFVNGLSFQSHEDYPCKICGKVFTKVKSRSAHMKSHRPPDQQQSDQQGMNHFQKKSKPSFTIPLETSTSMRMSSKSSGLAAVSRNNTIPPPLLEVPDTRLTSIKDKVT